MARGFGMGRIRKSILFNILFQSALLAVMILAFYSSPVSAGTVRNSRKFLDFEGREISRRQARPELLAKRMQEIRQLQKVLRTQTNPEIRADINHRIAAALKDIARIRYFMAVDRYERDYKLWERGKRRTKPKFPKENYTSAIKRYQAILARYPSYSETDEILFELGRLYSKMGKSSSALRYFEELTRRFPQSKYALVSEFAKADIYFDQRRWNDAIQSLRIVLSYGNTPYYNLALHKLAWVYYNQGRRRQAVETLKQVVARAGTDKAGVDLKEQALNDLVLFYSEIEGATEEAEAYFARMGKPGLTKKVLDKLSEVYYSQARWEKAIKMYKKLMEFDPHNVEVPEYQARIITAYRKKGDMAQSLKEMEKYIDDFYINRSKWARFNVKDKEAQAKVKREAEKYMRFLCKYWHQLAQKNKDQKLYAKAARYYRKYLKYFSDSKNAYEMRFFYAEVLYQLGKLADAAEQYEIVAKADSKGKYLKQASYAAVLCWDTLEKEVFKKLEDLRKKQRKAWKEKMSKRKLGAKEIPPPPIDTKPLPLSKYAKRLIAASLNFVKWNPTDSRVPVIQYNVPKTYYNYNHFPEALKGFKEIIKRFPRHEVAVLSRNLVLDTYNLLQDWDNLRLWATNFLHDRYFGPKNRKYLEELIQGAIFKKAIVLENEKKYLESANLYVELTDNYPHSKLAEKALYNSAIDFMLAGRPDLAIANSKRFIRRFPKSPLVEKTLLNLARYFENVADFHNAAVYYEMLAIKVPKSKHAADALYNAGLYRENLGEYSAAVKDYDLYIKRYPKRKDSSELFFAKAMIAVKLKQWRRAADLFRRYTLLFNDPDRVLEALYRRGDALVNYGRRSEGERSFRATVAKYNRYKKKRVKVTSGKKYVAKAELRLLHKLAKEYDSIKFRMPKRRLVKAIERKALLLKKLRDRYRKVISYGDAESGIEALYKIGMAFQKFASALFSAPVPKHLKPEEVELYVSELEKRARPIEEKAVDAFKKAVEKSFSLGILTPFTRLAYEQLSQYRPAQYPIHRGRRIKVRKIMDALYAYRHVYMIGRKPLLNMFYKKPKVK